MQISILSIFIAALFYVAFLILTYGLVSKILQYKNTPAPLKIPTMPAPTTQAGVVFRMSKEVVFFESLFKSSKVTWLFGWLFHRTLSFYMRLSRSYQPIHPHPNRVLHQRA